MPLAGKSVHCAEGDYIWLAVRKLMLTLSHKAAIDHQGTCRHTITDYCFTKVTQCENAIRNRYIDRFYLYIKYLNHLFFLYRDNNTFNIKCGSTKLILSF